MSDNDYDVNSYTFSLITQGRHKFYSLTLYSDVLGKVRISRSFLPKLTR